MNCVDFRNNINLFLNNKLYGNKLRQFVYHATDCKDCHSSLYDEFVFYTTYNDLDLDVGFDYNEVLDEKLNDVKLQFEISDKDATNRYIIISIVLCIVIIIALAFLVRFIYR